MTPPMLARYRACKRIEPVRDWDEDRRRFIQRCANDGIEVYAIRGGLRHDTATIKHWAAVERGES